MRKTTSRQTPAGSAWLIGSALMAAVAIAPSASMADASGELSSLPYYTALSDALSGEQAAFSAFAVTDDFRRAAGLERIDAAKTGKSASAARTAVEELKSEDANAADAAEGALASIKQDEAEANRGRFTSEAIANSTVKKRGAEWYCLTEALYFEARGESHSGQLAVAEVILNRVDSKRYPDSICGVIKQGQHRRNACQFSYNCDGRSNNIGNKKVFEKLGKLSKAMIDGKPRTMTDDALYYHNTSVKPRWAKKFVRTAQIGDHIFYRPHVNLSRK
ncbi:MAG: cell wall hydrolase [Paracoccaceae bacterium]